MLTAEWHFQSCLAKHAVEMLDATVQFAADHVPWAQTQYVKIED